MNLMRWTPDTCTCVAIQEWDGINTDTIKGVAVTKCFLHKDIPDEEVYGVIRGNPDSEANTQHQMGLYLYDNLLDVVSPAVKSDAQGEIRADKYNGEYVATGIYKAIMVADPEFFKLPKLTRGWYFNPKRQFVVKMEGVTFTTAQKIAIKAHMTLTIGTDSKILI